MTPSELDQARAFLEGHGLVIGGELVLDERYHRVPLEGERRTRASAWYRVFIDDYPLVICGSFKWGDRVEKWRPSRRIDPEAIRRHRERVQHEQARREAEEYRSHLAGAKRALEIWERASYPDRGHAYLVQKAIPVCGIRQLGADLIVPMRDERDALWNVQRIRPNGVKRFLSGARARGLVHAIGEPTPHAWLCEGMATACSLHVETCELVFAAFSSSNLLPAGEAIRRALPELDLTIMADDDTETEGNPGVTAAKKAAAALGCKWTVPEFPDHRPPGLSDFNDACAAWRVVCGQPRRVAR